MKGNSIFRQYSYNKKSYDILTSDTTNLILNYENEIKEMNEQIKVFIKQANQLEFELKELNSELRQIEKENDQNYSIINNISKEVYEIGNIKEFKPEELGVFDLELKRNFDLIKSLETQRKDLDEEFNEAEVKIKIIKSDQAKNQVELEDIREKVEDFKRKINENQFKIKRNKETLAKIEKQTAELKMRKELILNLINEIRIKKKMQLNF